jgi:hypothetical protein
MEVIEKMWFADFEVLEQAEARVWRANELRVKKKLRPCGSKGSECSTVTGSPKWKSRLKPQDQFVD